MKLHLGCGKRDFGRDWCHIDATPFDHVKHHSITLLPFEDESVDVIYASHVIEYFDQIEIRLVLKEWNRVLKKGATLRLAVPDFTTMARLYTEGKFSLQSFLGPLYGKMMSGDIPIYHKTVYDFDSLKKILEESGFASVERYDWKMTDHRDIDDHSQSYLPHMDKENGTLISLNVECTKI